MNGVKQRGGSRCIPSDILEPLPITGTWCGSTASGWDCTGGVLPTIFPNTLQRNSGVVRSITRAPLALRSRSAGRMAIRWRGCTTRAATATILNIGSTTAGARTERPSSVAARCRCDPAHPGSGAGQTFHVFGLCHGRLRVGAHPRHGDHNTHIQLPHCLQPPPANAESGCLCKKRGIARSARGSPFERTVCEADEEGRSADR